MRRIAVVGCSGSGKTTLARALAARLCVDHVELDSLFHMPGWQPCEEGEFREIVSARIAADSWVVDGNYQSAVQDLVWGAADTIVWLDISRAVVMRSVISRSLGRVLRREELWNGNRERLRFLFDPRPAENIILWSWTRSARYRARYREAMASGTPHEWVHLRTRAEADAWLNGCPEPGSSPGPT